ncbi:MAG TPA: hypothetical protein VJ647_04825 [Chitinophagaceae bacterium]|nr:hypothetical protein [Chitinophagaceae bacterium]
MKHLKYRVIAPVFLVICLNAAEAQVQTPRFQQISANIKGFYEYLPQGYNSGTDLYPLIIFLHGVGELGNGSASNLPKIIKTGLPALIQRGDFPVSFTVNSQSYKFIVVSPQFVNWPSAGDVNTLLDYVLQHYRVNTGRIYVTGLSMGGGATWDFAGSSALYNKRIAAIVPIAGASSPDPGRANRIADAGLPVWATHNNGDGTVPVSNTNGYINAILARNANAPVKKTIFSVNSHDAWTKTYDPSFKENNMNVYEWMLQYQKGVLSEIPASFEISPASVTDKFTLRISYPYRGSLKVQITDKNGNVKKEYQSNKDKDIFTQTYIIGNDLSAGDYLVRVQMAEILTTGKLLKL